jgi:hypothetical protein
VSKNVTPRSTAARLQGREAAQLLQVQAEQEHQTVEADGEGEAARHRDGHWPRAEQPERNHRVRRAHLGDEKCQQRNDCHGQGRDDTCRGETVGAALDEPVGQPAHSQDRGHLANPVERRRPAGRARHPREQIQRHHPDWQVDEEDGSPVQQREKAADDGAGRGGHGAAERPQRDGTRPLVRIGERLADER